MANQGVRGFYQITNTIKDQLLNDDNINTVTTGNTVGFMKCFFHRRLDNSLEAAIDKS